MVSYFVPRGRFLIKPSTRQSTKQQQAKWPMLRTFRQTFSTKSAVGQTTNTLNKTDSKVGDIIRNTNLTKNSSGTLIKGDASKQQRHNAWVKWTGFLLRLAPVGFCVFGAIEWQLHRQKCRDENVPRTASEFQSKVYCSLPLRILSRCWGWLAACYVPTTFRPYIYGWYSNAFNVNLTEALHPDYKHYTSLSEFFTRPLREGVRQIDGTSPLTSPADGKVLHFGPATNSLIEQVKGVNYSIESFLGSPTSMESNVENNEEYAQLLKENKDGSTELYQCVIYLAPGDYHRFHSPAEWKPSVRRHFAGELLSVSPKIAKWLPGLFCLNERALYMGSWQYGFFSYTAVGATNVGSVQIFMDDELKTNRWVGFNWGAHKKSSEYEELQLQKNIDLKKGDLVGQFNMGSTIVLLFEAPKNFKFNIKAGQKIYVGNSLGSVEDK